MATSPAIYHPRRPRASPLWQIVHRGWDDFVSIYDTFEPIDPPWTAIREWNPAANTESLLERQEAGVPYLALTRRSGA